MSRAVLVGIALAVALGGFAVAADPFAALDLIRPGYPTVAPAFRAANPARAPLRLSDFHGRTVLLNFWATWCGPCKQEMPSMERLYQRYKNRGFTVLAVSVDADGATSVVPFVEKLRLTFPIALDPNMEIANDYKVRALPSTFLIDRSGHTVAVALGPRDWNGAPAHALFESLLR